MIAIHIGRVAEDAPLVFNAETGERPRFPMEFTSGHLASVLLKFRPCEQGSGHALQWPDNMAGIYISPNFSHPQLESPGIMLSRTAGNLELTVAISLNSEYFSLIA
jgi:hypothetical protein